MLITRTPFRVSLFGGGTDYKEYFQENPSLLIGFAIDKYSYLSGRYTPTLLPYKSRFSYSQSEIIPFGLEYFSQIKHNGIRGVLEVLNIKDGIEISHFCDIPSQTGLGSSSSFIVGLINLILTMNWALPPSSKRRLAELAIKVEREHLGESGGIQDQIWAAYGGFNSINIDSSGFHVRPMPVTEDFTREFINRSVLIYTGKTRDSYKIASHDKKSIDSKKRIYEVALKAYEKFAIGDIDAIGQLLHESWQYKKQVQDGITNSEVDALYENLKDQGMIGGKLIGSGGSGFIFGILDEPKELTRDIQHNRLNFGIDYEWSKVIYQ